MFDTRKLNFTSMLRFADNKDLLEKHISGNKYSNAVSVLNNRHHLISKMPKRAICAEIGVSEGNFSTDILRIMNPREIHLVDTWDKRFIIDAEQIVRNRFYQLVKDGIVYIHKKYSKDCAAEFNDEYFDWVYIVLIISMNPFNKILNHGSLKLKREDGLQGMIIMSSQNFNMELYKQLMSFVINIDGN